MVLRSINPATEEAVYEVEELSEAVIRKKVSLAQSCFEEWRQTDFAARAASMKRLAEYLRQQKPRLAETISLEVGKTLAASEAEVEKCALCCDYYADNAATFLHPENIKSDAGESYVRFDPLGVVLAVMPWNFPLWQVFRFAAPALMAGNVGLLKHASNVQMSGEAIEQAFLASGFPEGAMQNLAISSAKVELVIRDPHIKAVTLTGSEHAGSQVAKTAGEEIKKTVLELGGSDPFIVLADSNIDAAVEAAVAARLQANAGQSCIAAKRFIVQQEVLLTFSEKLRVAVARLRLGDPFDKQTDVGPLATEQILHDVEEQVRASLAQGARLVHGGKRREGVGYYYQPTILSAVTKDMPVLREEVFGPVFPVIGVENEAEAVALANESSYGLGATIFSKDLSKAKEIAARIEAGAVFINNQVKSDPRLPFGGVKKSGYGRELSHYGIKEFVNTKTVWVR